MAKKLTTWQMKNLYVVFYEIIGSRCNGTYLVKAANKREARKAVLAVDHDYVVRGTNAVLSLEQIIKDTVGLPMDKNLSAMSLEDVALYNDELEMYMNGVNIPKMFGGVYQIECGT